MDAVKKKVLIIDDQEEIRELVTITLHGTEFDVLGAVNGREGIQRIKEYKPDLILLDIMMPGFDGFATCKIIKRNLSSKEIPVVFLTAKKTKEDITNALMAGGTDFIVKPFSPNDLLTRIRKIVSTKEVKKISRKKNEKSVEKPEKPKAKEIFKNKLIRYDDVIVCSDISKSISFENLQIYRDIFSNIVSDGIFKIVLDIANVSFIDGAGLSLLLSVNESLKSYGGELRLTSPANTINNQYNCLKINELFNTYPTSQIAVESYNTIETLTDKSAELENINICISCTYVNNDESRYCSLCGMNLIMSRGKDVLDIIRHSIMKRIISEAQTNNLGSINRNRNITTEKNKISEEFYVELHDENLTIQYKSSHTYSLGYETTGKIAIEAPHMNGEVFLVKPGMKVLLKTPNTGKAIFETEVKGVNKQNGMLFVRYNEEASIIHSKKNFSIAPKLPIELSLIDPSFQYTGDIIKGKILELSRVRMIVFAEERIPENTCFAANFELSEGKVISSPLVIAQRRKERYMYDLEFIIIDEKERSMITQYMYKRQIELAND